MASVTSFLQSDSTTASNFTTESSLGLKAFKAAFRYVNGVEDEATSSMARKNSTSAFDADMPGLITPNELEAKKHLLDQWKIKLGRTICSLQVTIKLKKRQSPVFANMVLLRTLRVGTNQS